MRLDQIYQERFETLTHHADKPTTLWLRGGRWSPSPTLIFCMRTNFLEDFSYEDLLDEAAPGQTLNLASSYSVSEHVILLSTL
jgi:hypothetical protein